MAKILITGSADGLGQIAARSLVNDGHKVYLHARNELRAEQAMKKTPGASGCIVSDLSQISAVIKMSEEANAIGTFDAIIHNAAVGFNERKRIETPDGLSHVFAVNSLAPYILTALIKRPKRLIYISSQLHFSGDESLHDLSWKNRPWNGSQAYSDSKLHIILLAFAAARYWPEVVSNCVEPGWVATKMGGAGASADLASGARTQAWLAAGGATTKISGDYFYHQKPGTVKKIVYDPTLQDRFLSACEHISGITISKR